MGAGTALGAAVIGGAVAALPVAVTSSGIFAVTSTGLLLYGTYEGGKMLWKNVPVAFDKNATPEERQLAIQNTIEGARYARSGSDGTRVRQEAPLGPPASAAGEVAGGNQMAHQNLVPNPRGALFSGVPIGGVPTGKGLPNEPPALKDEWVRPKGWQLPKNGTWDGHTGKLQLQADRPCRTRLKAVGDRSLPATGDPISRSGRRATLLRRKEALTGDPVADRTAMIKTIAGVKSCWTQQQVKDWLQKEQLSLHHAGGNDIQLIPWALLGNRSAIPPLPGITHQGGRV